MIFATVEVFCFILSGNLGFLPETRRTLHKMELAQRTIETWTVGAQSDHDWILLIKTHDIWQLKFNYLGPLHGLTHLVVNDGQLGANW